MVKRSIAGLDGQADALFPDNTTAEISPADLRSYLDDIRDSGLNTFAVPAGTVPITDATDGNGVGSEIIQTDEIIDVTRMLRCTGGDGLMFGGLRVIDAGFNISAVLPDNSVVFPVGYGIDDAGAPFIARQFLWAATRTDTPATANTSETFTGATISFRFINANTGIANRYSINSSAASDVTDCNLQIYAGADATGALVFDYKQFTGGDGFTIRPGLNPVRREGSNIPVGIDVDDLPGVGYFFRENQELFSVLTAGSGQSLSILGQTLSIPVPGGGTTNETFPHVVVNGRSATLDTMAGDNNVVSLISAKTGTERLFGAAIGLDTANFDNNLNNTITSIQLLADAVDDLTVPSTVIIEDEGLALTTNATTLNFVGGGVTATGTGAVKTITIPAVTAPTPSLHNLTIDIASRVNLNTDLNTSHTITFDVSNHSQLTGLTLVVTTGTDIVLATPVTDGQQSQNVTLAGIDTSMAGSVTFQLSGTHAGGTVTSNVVTVTIADLEQHEQVHFGFINQGEAVTDIDFTTDDISTQETTPAGNYTVSGIPTDGSLKILYFAVPSAFPQITSIFQGSFDLGTQFAAAVERTIDGETYEITLMLDGSAVNSNYNNTVLTVGVS